MSQLYLLAGAYWQPPRSATCPSSTLQELAGVTAVPVVGQETTGSLLGQPHVPALPCRSWQVPQLYLW